MDIEERAEQWVDNHVQLPELAMDGELYSKQDMVSAYLAGAVQAQSDFMTFFKGRIIITVDKSKT
jgi:hypothetical protein